MNAPDMAAACQAADAARPLVESGAAVLAILLAALAACALAAGFLERRRDWRWQRHQAAAPFDDDRSSLVRHRRHLDAQRARR